MKIDIIEKKENLFLKRTDLLLTVDHKGQTTPKKQDLEASIAQQFESVPEKVEIIYIFTDAGSTKAKVKARVWKEKIIEKKKVETPKETVPEEKKTEEVKEEAKPQEKPKEIKKEEKGEKK